MYQITFALSKPGCASPVVYAHNKKFFPAEVIPSVPFYHTV
jgi:hypothetical protein